jgi:FkbM family methyltransferase
MRFDYLVDWQGEDVPPRVVSFDLEGFDDRDRSTKMLEHHRTFYEADLLRHLGRCGPCGGVYLDVGAYIGNHAVFFGTFLADFVVAIEPMPRAARVLARNLAANGVPEYAVVNRAVGAAPGHGRLWRPAEFPRWAAATQVITSVAGEEGADRGEVVPITTVDRVLADLAPRLGDRPVTLMKVDVEGMECDVLIGAAELMRRHRPQLVVELRDEDAYERFTAMIAAYGYRRIGRFCATPTYHFIIPSIHQLRTTPCDRIA